MLQNFFANNFRTIERFLQNFQCFDVFIRIKFYFLLLLYQKSFYWMEIGLRAEAKESIDNSIRTSRLWRKRSIHTILGMTTKSLR